MFCARVIDTHTIVRVFGRIGGIAGYIKDCTHDGHVGWVRGVGA